VLSAGTANGVTYLNGSKSLTSGTGLVFDGTNLGIGVTPSAWAAGYKFLQTTDTTSAYFGGSGYAAQIGANSYINSSSNWVRAGATYAVSQISQFDGKFIFNQAAAGTAGSTITWNSAMTLDASGNLGIGTTSPARKLHVVGTIGSYNSANDSQILMYNNGTVGSISVTYGTTGSYLPLTFLTSDTERMRIDSSGRLLLGTSTVFDSAYTMSLKVVSSTGGLIIQPGADNYTAIAFNNAAGVGKGSISVSATATTYNTSSDYRLKENVQPMSGALAKVSALKPVTYKWKIDGTDSQGFIAHELAEVCPHAVTGEKDAVDADGNPKYQGIDTSFLVATLTAAIQEQQALITALTARITALEAK
jgi:hypothetical protein